jgi:hypothetical protein
VTRLTIVNGELFDKLQAQKIVRIFEEYISQNPNMVVIDPFHPLRNVINRFKTYSLINTCLPQFQGNSFGIWFSALFIIKVIRFNQ